ncbi:hypothetical protein T12_6037 [Trichinella patagoniensis]|uniref:Uncharacterized protein n=1 Tax=Trichinella patagoniensis TaxID=990121 RepID=A0A0V0Z615_9BILA|nr:hypothetical protein T12_6037 [Trichinella patagoniensis]
MVLYRGALRKERGAVKDSELYDGLWERPEAFIECG